MARVSVIIPCFNQGIYIAEAIDSVLSQTYRDFEIVVVNDGSTDEQTIAILASLHYEKTRVITTTNQGLAAARNNGIFESTGDYILPLDADDRIAPEYIERGVKILENKPECGIVYCRAMLFGEIECEWSLPPYNFQEMLKDNVIFCSALFRRSDWDEIGGYDTGMIYGWEDYEFWLSIIERGRTVSQLDEKLFYYRVSADSMVRTKEKWQKTEMFARIYRRHQTFFSENIEVWLENIIELNEPYFTSRLYVDDGKGFNENDSLARKVTLGNHQISYDISEFDTPQHIRFDPLECSTCVRIERITLVSAGRAYDIDMQLLTSNADCQYDNVFMFSSNDPNIFVSVPTVDSALKTVDIEFSILSLGEQSLREIISYQKGHRHLFQSISGKLSHWLRFKKTGNH